MADKLMKVSAWSAREFSPESIPDPRTVKSWIENGVIRGRIIDSKAYVFESVRYGVEEQVSTAVDALIRLGVNNNGRQTQRV